MTNTWVISDCTAIKCSIPESNVIGGQGFPWLIRKGLILFLGVCGCEKMRKNHYFYSSLFAYQKKKKKSLVTQDQNGSKETSVRLQAR